MSNIIFPKRWATKPPVSSQINWGHPLAQGIKFLCLFNESTGEPYDLVMGRSHDVWNMTWVHGPEGDALRADGSTVRLIDCGSSFFVPEDRVTVALIRMKTDATLRNSTTFGMESGAAGNRCGAHVPYGDGTVYWDFGGNAAPGRLTVAGLSFSARAIEKWVFIAGAKGSSIWRDGVEVANQGTAITRTGDSSLDFEISRGNNVSGSDAQDFIFFAMLEAEWTGSQVQEWTAEPYAFIAPQAPRHRFFIVAGVSIPVVMHHRMRNF